MPSPDNALEEIRRLRRTMRDLVALSTLPAVWIGLGPDRIARSLADVLLNTLALDLVYVQLTCPAGEGTVELVRSKCGREPADVEAVRPALAPLLNADQTESPATIADPFGNGMLHVAVTRFGVGDDHGVLITGSRNTGFPSEQDRVLLGVGANQTAIVLQRRRAEERLHEQQEWLRVTLASIGDAVLATDTEGRVTFLNSVAEELTGWTLSDAQGKPLETVFAVINEQTRQPVENPVEKVLRDGITVGLGNHTVLLVRSGRELPIDDSAAPIRDATGKMIGVVLIFRDVTEQRRAERDLRASEDRKSAILETALDCIITIDHEGKVVEFNPAAERTFGYSRAEVVGRQLADLIIPRSLRERHHNGLAHYLATGKGPLLGQRLELPALHADGSEFPVELAITCIPTDGPPLFTAYLRDITERKRAEQHRNTRLAVIQALTQATSIQEGASGVLQAVCDNLGWDVGFFWLVDHQKHAIACRKTWHRADVPVTAFERASGSKTFGRGEGLPGRVWATSEPAWLLDVTQDGNFPRAASAAEEGLRSAFACPIVVGDETLGVIEFFTRHLREPDPDLLEMMATMAGTFGQFIERTQAEEALRESVEHLRAVVETTPACIKVVAADGTLLDMNPAGLAMVDADRPEQVKGKCVYGLIDEEYRNAFRAFNEQVCRGVKGSFEFEIVGLRGTRRHMETHAAPLRGVDGNFVQLAITQDITERKRAEQALAESEQRFRATVEQAAVGLAHVGLDGRWLRVNQKLCDIVGYSREEMMELTFQEITHPDDLDADLEQVRRVLAGEIKTYSMEKRYIRKDGEAAWINLTVSLVRRESGEPDYFISVIEDITARKSSEEALRQSQDRLDLALHAADLGQWELSLIDHTASRNLRHDQIFGYDSLLPEWTYEMFLEHVVPEDRAVVDAKFQQAQSSGEAWDLECRIRTADGDLRWIWARGRAYQDDEGELRRMAGTVADVTERKRIEMALQDTRSRLDAALEAGAIATWTWDIPNNRLFTDTSLARLFNLSPSEAEGGLLEKYVQSIHPDDWPRVSAALSRSVESGEDYEADYRIKQPDGSVRWVVARGRAERDETGRPVRMPGVLVDITERKRLEEELRVRVEQLADANRHKEDLLASLRESEEKLRLLANTIPQLAWMARPDGHIFWYNRRWYEYTGTTLEQMEGWGWQSVHDPEVLPKVLQRWQAAIESGEPFEMVFPLRGADERFRPYLTRVNPLKDEEGRILYWFGTNTDISEIKRMEEALREADRRKDEFLATLAHELRNPLAPIRSGLELLKMVKDDPATVEATRTTMERQTEQLITLVDDLLDVSRITRGKLELRKCRVKLSDVTQSAVEASRPVIDEAGHELMLAIPDEPIHLDADPHRLAQVVSNLLNNAAKYTPEGGRIWLAAERQGSDVVISVTDTGIGIPADMLDRIFEMFAQIDRPMERGYTGLGIGLTLVKSLVEMHGGRVEVHSEGTSRGSEFRVRLPILVETPVEEQTPVQSREMAIAQKNCRVLVVDDNKAAADMLSMVVRMLGNEVRTAGDGQQGIEVAGDFLPDVVLMDLGMPKLNGYEAARYIRQQPWGEKMMLIALTGWGQEEDKQRTKEAGFNYHLVKPAEPAQLQRLLQEVKNSSTS